MSSYELPKRLSDGQYWVPVSCGREDGRIYLAFPYNKSLLTEIKAFDGARWHPEFKAWSFKDNDRNRFQLDYLAGRDPYSHYDLPLLDVKPRRLVLYPHQVDMFRQMATRRRTLIAGEPGVGKTLATIEAMEHAASEGVEHWWYVAPKGVLAAVKLEFKNWRASVEPTFLTYEGMTKVVENWKSGEPSPQGVVFDESQRLKNLTAKRSRAARHLADAMRREHGDAACIFELTGTPSPKSPLDWYSQCEIACPGFIKEGTIDKFHDRLARTEQRKLDDGGTYRYHVCWWDDSDKCKHCGTVKAEHEDCLCSWEPSVNEVEVLGERLQGLVWIGRKKDCLPWLPELVHRVIECEPSQSYLNAAKLIAKTSPTTIGAMIRFRELSDGFIYDSEGDGDELCPLCQGEGAVISPEEEVQITCPHCKGSGLVVSETRVAKRVPCPKDDALADILESHEDNGRLVVYGGFEGTLDRICDLTLKLGWQFIRADGKGWKFSDPSYRFKTKESLLEAFQDKSRKIPRLAFVGQPEAAGAGLTLTEAPELVFYSNSFNGESRMQAKNRVHRPGMDVNKGALYTDLLHLPSDRLVLDNLERKIRLQDIPMSAVRATFGEN